MLLGRYLTRSRPYLLLFSWENRAIQETKVQRECVDSRDLKVNRVCQDPEACRESKESVDYLAHKDDRYALYSYYIQAV